LHYLIRVKLSDLESKVRIPDAVSFLFNWILISYF